MVAGGEWEGVWLLVVLGFLFLRFPQANKKAFGSGSTSILPRSSFPQAHGGCEAEGWSWVGGGGGSYASTSRPDPWRSAALAAVAPTTLPLSPSFNKVVFLLLDHSIWCYLKIFTEVQQMGYSLLLEQQLAGKDELFVPSCMGLIFFLNKRKLQACARLDNILACKHWSACPLKLLEIRPRSGQFCAPCGSSWKQLRGHAIHHLPRQFEGGLLVDGRPKRKFWKESMVLQVGNLHMRIRGSFPNPCFSAQFEATACQCEDGDFAQVMVIWLEPFMCRRNYSELLLDSATEVATSLLLISNYWYAELSLYHILALEILNL